MNLISDFYHVFDGEGLGQMKPSMAKTEGFQQLVAQTSVEFPVQRHIMA